ncbi:ankyrin repeat domain-containing protein 13C-like protein [Pitangus sulphuratus]|nr:ankyrin repeat domain-containing protein 13C-like protein [Pitangus sulphuratus]
MTGEKLRSLRRDHKPSKEDGDLLAAGEDEAAAAPGGAFTGGKGGRAGGHRGPGNHRHRPPARAAPAGPERGPFPVHECVFKGDVRRLSALIRTQGIAQKDSHECAHLLLAHNAPVKVKNAQGWSPLAEAISYGDRQMISALLRKLKQQSRESVEEKRPRLLKALKEESEMETEEEVDILMSSDIYSATLSTKSITFTRAQTGWLFREDKTERVGNFLADFYLVNGLVLESRKRREHLSEEDILRNKAIMESLSKGGNLMEQNFEPVRRQSLTPPSPNTITWEEYISAESGKAPHLGRELVCKESKKTFKATIAMSQEFPLGIESLLNVLEVIAPFKHFNKLREFVQMKLPPGFPVKLDIPVFPTITATVTFQEFRYDEFDDSIFTIPDDYKEDPSRFPDL